MANVTVYSFEGADGTDFGSYTTTNLNEAKEYGRTNALKVIANEYEFSDSELVEDFTANRQALVDKELASYGVSLHDLPEHCEFTIAELEAADDDAIILVEQMTDGAEIWASLLASPEAVEQYLDAQEPYGEAILIMRVGTGELFDAVTTTTVRPR